MKTASWLLMLLLFLGCLAETASGKEGESSKAEWQTWKREAQDRFNEPLSNPTITHHVYLDLDTTVAWLKTDGRWPQWTTQVCADCPWSAHWSDGKVAIYSRKNQEKLILVEDKELSLTKTLKLSLSRYSNKKVRVFVHDLGQVNLPEKRKRRFFPYNSLWKKSVEFQWLKEISPVTIQRSDGSQEKFYRFAELEILSKKSLGKLTVYGETDKKADLTEKKTMLLFRDYSNGKKTYGAGRFLTMNFGKPIKSLKGGERFSLDFNFSYNPPCAVSTGFHCPLPQDLVMAPVEVGERYLVKK